MAKDQIDVSIVVVSFNTKNLTSQLITSIVENTKNVNYEIILIDNNSSDGSSQMLKDLFSKHDDIKLVLNKSNKGFGGANNQGMVLTSGRYVLLLNSDTVINDNVLGYMVSWMDKHPKAGIATCGLFFRNGDIQGTGGYFPNLFRVFMWMTFLDDLPGIDQIIKSYHPHEKYFKNVHMQDWITGAFFFIRKEVVEQVKNFDKDYFMYVEEVDYCYRTKKLGWEIWYLPEHNIIHYGGASSTAETPIIGEIAGLKIFYKKHYSSWQLSVLKLILKFGILERIILFGILKGRQFAKIYAKAFNSV